MNFWTDTHAHIYLSEFSADKGDVINRCKEAGVKKIFMPNIDHTSIDAMMEWESVGDPDCVAMMGLHPCSVKKGFEKELYLVENWLSKRKFAAIGEMGTDLYWDKTYWEEQKEAFRIQVGWAQKYTLPIVIHCRESIEETIALVEELKTDDLTGVFHCFTGSLEQARRINKLGFYLGIGGVATFKNSGLDKIIPELDLDYVILETDSPYLSPVPHRGKRNEPSYIPLIADKIAQLKSISTDDIQRITTKNALNLFENHK